MSEPDHHADRPAGGDVGAVPTQPPPPVPARTWGLGDALAGWALGALGATVVLSLGSPGGRPTLLALALAQTLLWACLVGAMVRASRRKGAGTLERDFGLRFRATDVAGAALGLLAQLVLVPVVSLPLRWFVDNPDLGKEAKDLAQRFQGPAFAIFAVVTVVGAPVVEELFFRGLVLRGLERRWGTGWAVVGSAVAFGAAHLQPMQLPALIALGLVLALLAVRFDRLGPGILAHAAFNALTVASLYVQR